MTIISSDGLSLLVGDGATTEVFSALKGARVTRLEIVQRGYASTAVTNDAWIARVGTGERQAVIECEAFANDEPAALRVRALALSGQLGNFRLEMQGSQTLQASAYVLSYREEIRAGEVKIILIRLESSSLCILGFLSCAAMVTNFGSSHFVRL
jgi:Phage tail tube protein